MLLKTIDRINMDGESAVLQLKVKYDYLDDETPDNGVNDFGVLEEYDIINNIDTGIDDNVADGAVLAASSAQFVNWGEQVRIQIA